MRSKLERICRFAYSAKQTGANLIYPRLTLTANTVWACHLYLYKLHANHTPILGLSKGYPLKNIFDFTTAGDWDCVVAVERLPALHYSVDFISLSFGIMSFIVEL